MTTKILTINDYDAIMNLHKEHAKIMTIDKTGEYWTDFTKYLKGALIDESSLNTIIGTFKDEELIATIGMYFWAGFPYWSVNSMTTKKDEKQSPYDLYNNGTSACMDLCTELAELQKRYKCYFCMADSHFQISQKITVMRKRDNKKTPSRWSQYNLNIEAIVEKNTKPDYDYQWALMGRKEWNTRLIIAYWYLTPKEQQTIFLGNNDT